MNDLSLKFWNKWILLAIHWHRQTKRWINAIAGYAVCHKDIMHFKWFCMFFWPKKRLFYLFLFESLKNVMRFKYIGRLSKSHWNFVYFSLFIKCFSFMVRMKRKYLHGMPNSLFWNWNKYETQNHNCRFVLVSKLNAASIH